MAQNLFQASTYESHVTAEELEDMSPLEQDAMRSQIRYFGQCPVVVFPASPAGLGHP